MSALPAAAARLTTPVANPREHAARVRTLLDALSEELREDLRECDEPKAQALFETAAEVLQGLRTAFDHYERGTEAARRE